MEAILKLYSYCLTALGLGFLAYKFLFSKIVSWHEVSMEFLVLATYFVIFSYLLSYVWSFFTRQNKIKALYINAFLHIVIICAIFFFRATDITVPETATLLTGYFQGIMFVLLDTYTAAFFVGAMFLLQLALLAQAGYKNYIQLTLVATIYYVVFMATSILITLCAVSLL